MPTVEEVICKKERWNRKDLQVLRETMSAQLSQDALATTAANAELRLQLELIDSIRSLKRTTTAMTCVMIGVPLVILIAIGIAAGVVVANL